MDRQLDETEELWRSLRNDIMRRGADLDTAEDVAQETWLRAVRRPPKDRGKFRGWLHVVATRFLNETRQSQQARTARERAVARVGRSSEVHVEATALSRWVEELPDPYRTVIRLRYFEDRDVSEIAELTGQTQSAVRSQLKRGLRRLRSRIGTDPDRRGMTWWLGSFWLRLFRSGRPRSKALMAGGLAVLLTGVAAFVIASSIAPREAPRVRSEDASPGMQPRPAFLPLDPGLREPDLRTAVVPQGAAAGVRRLTGSVRDPDGQPVAGATVRAAPRGDQPPVQVETDPSGRYEVVVGRDDLLWASHPSWYASNRCYVASVSLGANLDLFLAPSAGRSVIRVQSPDGAPVVGASLVATPQEGVSQLASERGLLEFLPPRVEVTTDSSGRAEVPLPEQGWIELFVRAEGYPAWSQALSVREADSPVLSLPLSATVVGKVYDDAGLSAPGASVELLQFGGRQRLEAKTGEDGTFRIEGVSPGAFVLRVLEDARIGTLSLREENEVKSGALRVDVGTLTLGMKNTIHGRVLDGGSPAAGALVFLRTEGNPGPEGDPLRTTTTDASGRYSFGGCCPRSHHQVFTRPPSGAQNGGFEQPRLNSPAVDLSLELGGPAAPVELEFTGDRIPRLVELRREPWSLLLEPEAGTSLFRSPPLHAGTFQVFAWIPELGTWSPGPIDHSPVAPIVHDSVAPAGGELLVEVKLPPGCDRRKVQVSLVTDAFNSYGLGDLGLPYARRRLPWAEDQGAFTALVPPRDAGYFVLVRGPGLADTTVHVVVQDGQECRLVLEPAPGIETRLDFSAPRSLLFRERLGLEFDSPWGKTKLDLQWFDQVWRKGGFSFGVRVPTRMTEIRAESVLRKADQIKPLRGTRAFAPGGLESVPDHLDLVLEKVQ